MWTFFVIAAKKLVTRTSGATLSEYALLLALIVVVCIAAVQALANNVLPLYPTSWP
jgi:Flp pilus assembly pilin Flp